MAKGVKYQGRKLNIEAVLAMGKLWKQGCTTPEIAEKYDVSEHAVDDVLSGRTWGGLGKVREPRKVKPRGRKRRSTSRTPSDGVPTALKMAGAGGDYATAGMATPPEATLALLDTVKFTEEVWEPTCGQGVMAETIKSRGYKVFASDVKDYDYRPSMVFDFFEAKSTIAESIIANIDFRRVDAFIAHALSLKPAYLAVLVRATYWHAAKRRDLFVEQTPWLILPMTFRPDFNGKGAPVIEFMWVVWKRGYQGKASLYYPLDRPVRIDEHLNTMFMRANHVETRSLKGKTRRRNKGGAHTPNRPLNSPSDILKHQRFEARKLRAIETLAEYPGLTTAKLADMMGCHPLGLTRTLTIMSKQGLIARVQPHVMGFATPWALTEDGGRWLTNYKKNTSGGNGNGEGR